MPQSLPVAAADALIEIDHVSFGYDARRTILKDVTLNFPRGKVTAILGGSGCGKTTLLRLIGGVHEPSSGQVRFDGKPVNTSNRAELYKFRRRWKCSCSSTPQNTQGCKPMGVNPRAQASNPIFQSLLIGSSQATRS